RPRAAKATLPRGTAAEMRPTPARPDHRTFVVPDHGHDHRSSLQNRCRRQPGGGKPPTRSQKRRKRRSTPEDPLVSARTLRIPTGEHGHENHKFLLVDECGTASDRAPFPNVRESPRSRLGADANHRIRTREKIVGQDPKIRASARAAKAETG